MVGGKVCAFVAVLAVASASEVDVLGHAYATKPWDATFHVDLDGQPGGEQESFTVRVHPEWAPEGAKRFQDIVGTPSVLSGARFFRVVPNFMVQFGIPGNPEVASEWHAKDIPDDPPQPEISNKRGYMTYATAGPGTRTTQMFINFKDNSFLDSQGFTPFAEVLDNGMAVVDRIQSKYLEQPNQGLIQTQGNEYLQAKFPELSFVSEVSSSLGDGAEKESL
eukprot:TRINITY_DN2657_c0_g2_i1.p1 TRINITY_DN2657_c0_g2~~TRINITY_DN2657_c0_g2_i1.p1  ORF type:complete len:242 (-),score=47.85 TRINITY_DN2657_c0_g2_i1:408-1070(-)